MRTLRRLYKHPAYKPLLLVASATALGYSIARAAWLGASVFGALVGSYLLELVADRRRARELAEAVEELRAAEEELELKR